MTTLPARAARASRALAVLVLAALLVLAVRRLDLSRVVMELSRAHPGWIISAVLANAAILPLWAAQWWLLTPASPRRTWRRMFAVIAMTSTVLNTTPMLVGEAAGVFFLAAWTGCTRAAGLAVLGMDQLLVGVAKLTVLGATALVVPLPPWMVAGVKGLVLAVGALLAMLLLLARRGRRWESRVRGLVGARISDVLMRGSDALAPLTEPARGGSALLLALLKKGAELLAILAVQRAFGVALPVSSCLLVLATLNLATLLPVVPGNVGIYEAAVVLAYGYLGVPAERALGMAVVQHLAYFAALAVPGYWWLARGVVARSAMAER